MMRELCLFLAVAAGVSAATIAEGERLSFYFQDSNFLKSKQRSTCSICPDAPNKVTWLLTTEELSGTLQGELYTYDGTLYHSYAPQEITASANPVGEISSEDNYVDVDWGTLTTGGRFRFDLINVGAGAVSLKELWVQLVAQTLDENGQIVAFTSGAKAAPAYEGVQLQALRVADYQNEAPAPEPGAFGLLGLGLAGLVYYHRLHSA
jgi:hypothetical protein